MSILNTNDGTHNPPALKLFLNTGTLAKLPRSSSGPKGSLETQYNAIREQGFQGLQDGNPAIAKKCGLDLAASGRVNHPSEVEPLIEGHMLDECVATTLHVGWGTEYDHDVDQLVSKILDISKSYKYPIFIETHRATITQDNWRTVQIVKRIPEIRFNGDFSHWYTGHEMVYGDWAEKIDFIRPILERVRFVHGRISTPGSVQAPLSTNMNELFVQHFRQIWNACFRGFLQNAKPGDYLIFAPELLNSDIYYAQTYAKKNGKQSEHTDRWEDALLTKQIAIEEFTAVKNELTLYS